MPSISFLSAVTASLGLSAVSLLPQFVATAAAAEISVAPIVGPRGASLATQVILNTNAGEDVAGLQFQIDYDPAVMSIAIVAGDAARSNSKSIYVADPSAGRKRILVAGANQNAVDAGTIATLYLNIRRNAAPGSYSVGLSQGVAVTIEGGATPLLTNSARVTVSDQVATGTEVILPGALRNAASLTSGPVTPGEMVTIFGSAIGPAEVEGATDAPDTRILFGGIPAVQVYASEDQVSAVVPSVSLDRSTTSVRLNYGNVDASTTVAVAASSIGVFTLDSSGSGQAAALNADGSLNAMGNGSLPGERISIFATGIGSGPVSARVGGTVANLISVTPLQIGIAVVTVEIPGGLKTTPAAAAEISCNGSTSQPGVTIAIR